MILDTVAARDVHHVRRADLVEEWALLKVQRDILESQRWGTSGRPPIAGETSTRATVELSFAAMEAAAWLMTSVHEGQLLLRSGDAREIAARVTALSRATEYDGLVLNSLFVSVERLCRDRAAFGSHTSCSWSFSSRGIWPRIGKRSGISTCRKRPERFYSR